MFRDRMLGKIDARTLRLLSGIIVMVPRDIGAALISRDVTCGKRVRLLIPLLLIGP